MIEWILSVETLNYQYQSMLKNENCEGICRLFEQLFEYEYQNKLFQKQRFQLPPADPTLYLLSGYLQAYFGAKDTSFDQSVYYNEEIVEIEGKGSFLLEWGNLQNCDGIVLNDTNYIENHNKLIIIVPGITASSNEPYIINMISECLKKGYKVVLFNDRLYSLKSPKFHLNQDQYYCYLDDFSHVLRHVFENTNYKEYYAIGHSMGANTLVRYLGTDNTSKLNAVVSVANPWNLKIVSEKLKGIYDKYILESRQSFLQMKKNDIQSYFKSINKNDINIELCLKTKTSQEYDDCFTKKIHGNYPDVNEYLDYMTSANHVQNIKIPLLCLQSLDDPICHFESIPVEQCKQNQNIILWMSETGGHVGWYQGFFNPKRWYMSAALEFIDFHSNSSQGTF